MNYFLVPEIKNVNYDDESSPRCTAQGTVLVISVLMSLRPLSFQIRLRKNCKYGGDHQGAAHEEVTRQIAVRRENPSIGQGVDE